MSAGVSDELCNTSRGPIVCVYSFDVADVIADDSTTDGTADVDTSVDISPICIICNVGSTRAMNVLCAKVEAERCRHQLKSLRVFREKIRSEKPSQEVKEAAAEVAAKAAAAEAEAEAAAEAEAEAEAEA